MAIKEAGRYYAGALMQPPDYVEELGPELPDVRDDGRFGEMYCKYCYADGPTVSSYEHVFVESTVQALCANCGAGLTPCKPYEGSAV